MAKSIQNATDSEFLDIMQQVKTAVNANPADYPNVTAAMKTALDDAIDDFGVKLPTHIDSKAQARADRLAKDASRDIGEQLVRSMRRITKESGASEAALAAMGIPAVSEKAPPSATYPIASVDTSERLRHTISWTDAETPNNKKKPIGAMGAEIYVKIGGAPPVDASESTFLTVDSRTPFTIDYPGADAGKMAHYLLRWRMTDGTTRAWGETVSATITG